MIRATIALLAVLAFLLPAPSAGAPASSAVDIYITATVGGRVRGKNAALVNVRWDYKCFSDRLGDATYRWTLQAVRLLPRPHRTSTLQEGTSKSGSMRVRLGPGRYEPRADPFRCETSRGAGWAEPEIGAQFVVPDFCSWSVAAGTAFVDRSREVRRLHRGDLVRPGDVLRTARETLRLTSREGGSVVAVAPGSRVRVDRRHCARRGGWRFALASGSVRSRLAESDRRPAYEVVTSNARSTAGRADWTVQARRLRGAPWSRVTVRAGRVVVQGSQRGSNVTLRAGMATIVEGAG